MDLVTTVRKEGSRGGRDAFTWDSVKSDAHRENYLGHSLMAPVGRWQAKRDLSWYAKGDGEPNPTAEEDARKEEIRRIKEAEEDALSAALGLPVAPRIRDDGSRLEKGEVDRALRETVGNGGLGEEDGGVERGLGFGQLEGRGTGANSVMVKREDNSRFKEGGLQGEFGRREKKERRRSKSRERDWERERRHRRRLEDDGRYRRHSSRSRDGHRKRRSRARDEDRRRRSLSRDYDRRQDDRRDQRIRERSRSPKRRRRPFSRDGYHDE